MFEKNEKSMKSLKTSIPKIDLQCFLSNLGVPGDSVRDLLIPDREGGHQQPLKRSRFHHHKKVTKNCSANLILYNNICT